MRSQPRWLSALGKTRDPVYVVDSAQRIVCWNAGAYQLFGYSEAEVLNQPCYQVINGKICNESWCRADCAVQKSARRGIFLQTFEMQVKTRGGRVVHLAVSIFSLEWKSRRFTIHLLRDTTQEEHTKEALENVLHALRVHGIADGDGGGSSEARLQIHDPPPRPSSVGLLTRREIEVLGLLAEGHSTKELAKRLGVSPFTIRSHIESILLKTGLHTQAQAVAYAYRVGLL